MQYEIKIVRGGKRKIIFQCVACHEELTAPFEDAGQEFACPNCKLKGIMPGLAQLQAWKKEEADKRATEAAASAAAAATKIQLAQQLAAEREAARTAQLQAKEAKRLERKNHPRNSRLGPSLISTVIVILLLIGLGYISEVRPLQRKLAAQEDAILKTQAALLETRKELVHTSNELLQTSQGLNSLTDTVNHNADAANRTVDRLSTIIGNMAGDLSSLTQTVNRNANVANYNNRLR